jgi:outer membrane protein
VKRIAALLLLALAVLPAVAKDSKVGYINIDRVIEGYEGAVEAKRQLNEAITKFEATADTLRTEHERIKAEYESQQLTLSEEGKRAKAAEVDAAKRRYDSYMTEVYSTNGRIDQKNRELIAPIVEKVDSIVSRLAVEEGYDLVLDASKSGIVFSQSGLDLTQPVIDELNREYEPVAPTTPTKLVYAIMPVFNTNDQAIQDRIGAQVRQFAYGLFSAEPKTDMVANARIDQELTSRGFTSGEVTQQQAIDVARALNADYAVFGKCTKQDRRISMELSVANVRLSTLVKTQTGEASRVEDLQQQVGEIIRVLLAAIERP